MSNGPSENPLKKWAMMWLWRIQQISLPMTLAITAVNLSMTIAVSIAWRLGSYYMAFGISLTLLLLVAMGSGYLWDRKARMWHEQSVVMVERNPFYRDKMNPKEVVMFLDRDIYILRALGGEAAKKADGWERWCLDQLDRDPVLKAEVETLRKTFFGKALT